MMQILFSPPDISKAEVNEVADVLCSGWITTGPRTKELEKKCAEWIGVPKCVCLNSQTACAEMMLRLLGVGETDDCITSAYTYTATASVVCVGAVVNHAAESHCQIQYNVVANFRSRILEKTKVVSSSDW